MAKEKNEIKQTIKKIAKDCTQVHEVYEDLGNIYERISNLPGKGYEKKYDLMTVIGAKSEYTKRFTVKNDFAGDEDIGLCCARKNTKGILLFCAVFKGTE